MNDKKYGIENARLQVFIHLVQRELAPYIGRVPVNGDPDYAMMACLLDQCAEIAAEQASMISTGTSSIEPARVR